MTDPYAPWLDPNGTMSQQGAANMGGYQANNGYLTPQGQNEPFGVYQTRVGAYDAEQRRLEELRRMQGGF